MGERSGIEWTEATWNPWQGCTKISPGCKHCYMYREKERYGQDPFTVVRSKDPTFRAPLKWTEGRVIFTCSWSDWWHTAADDWRADAWEIIRRTPQHTYLILTKRADRVDVPWNPQHQRGRLIGRMSPPPEWRHVWVGVSIESQPYGNRMLPLAQLPLQGRRFVSAEPLLGPLDLSGYLEKGYIDWLIAGGESGPGFRAMDLGWVRRLRDDCVKHRVPFMLKQLGGWPDKHGHEKAQLDGRRWLESPVMK